MTKTPGTGLLSMKDLETKWASDAKDARARIALTGNVIGIRNSKFSYQNNVIGRTMECVVVDFIHANTWYEDAFDPDNPAPPDCQALSVDGEEMAPFKASPKKQSDFCDGCKQNAWGTADRGRGKACGNQYKLAVLAVKPGEDFSSCDIALLTVPPTSRKNWQDYVVELDDILQRPPSAVLTAFSFAEDEEWPVLEFETAGKVAKSVDAMAIIKRIESARQLLMTPPNFSGQADAASKKKGKKKAKKTRAKVDKKARASKKKTAKKKAAAKKKASKKTTSRGSKFS